jgi:hypothetical protein
VAAVGFRCGAAVQAVASEERGSCENDVRGRREETRRERDKGKSGNVPFGMCHSNPSHIAFPSLSLSLSPVSTYQHLLHYACTFPSMILGVSE